jgi:hypothetical protein
VQATQEHALNAELFLKQRVIPKVDGGKPCFASFDEVSAMWFGRGIVIISGRPLYLANAYINLCFIRRELKCSLPVEIWHLGAGEKNDRMFGAFSSLGGINFVDASEVQRTYPMKLNKIGRITHGFAPATTDGWRTKAYALLHSRFREVIFLDSDCFLFQRPELLFDTLPEYLDAGAVFSADIDTNPETPRKVDPSNGLIPRVGSFINREWDYSLPNPIWGLLGIQEDDLPEFDSGFMMIDKGVHVDPSFLSFFLNDNSDVTYRFLYGDKDTFHMAWAFCGSPCRVLRNVSRDSGHIVSRTMGSVLFEHRVFVDKFDVERGWDEPPNNNPFHMRDSFRHYFDEARRLFSVKIF